MASEQNLDGSTGGSVDTCGQWKAKTLRHEPMASLKKSKEAMWLRLSKGKVVKNMVRAVGGGR